MDESYTLPENTWLQIKQDYLSGVKPKELSVKYDVPYDTIRTRIKREGWVQERDLIQLASNNRFVELTAEALAETQITRRFQYAEYFEAFSSKIMQLAEFENDPVKIKTLVGALNECRKGEFACLGIKDSSDESTGVNNTINVFIPKEAEGWG